MTPLYLTSLTNWYFRFLSSSPLLFDTLQIFVSHWVLHTNSLYSEGVCHDLSSHHYLKKSVVMEATQSVSTPRVSSPCTWQRRVRSRTPSSLLFCRRDGSSSTVDVPLWCRWILLLETRDWIRPPISGFHPVVVHSHNSLKTLELDIHQNLTWDSAFPPQTRFLDSPCPWVLPPRPYHTDRVSLNVRQVDFSHSS